MFEDSVVDFFESTDTDGDGLIDYDDFYNVSQFRWRLLPYQ